MGKYDPAELFPEGYVPISSRHPVTPRMFVEGLKSEFTTGMSRLYGPLVGRNDLWDFALDLAMHDDPHVAFRGSWALEWAYFNDREAFGPHVDHFIGNYMVASNRSVHRHYTKMLWDMMRRGIYSPDPATAERLAERTFDLLIDPQTKVAVKVWAMEILFDLSPAVGWVGENLRETVEHMMRDEPSMGIANRGRKLLRRMDGRSRK